MKVYLVLTDTYFLQCRIVKIQLAGDVKTKLMSNMKYFLVEFNKSKTFKIFFPPPSSLPAW